MPRFLGLVTVLVAFHGSALAAGEQCLAAATTELERLYCQVISEGGGAGLPSQPDFNRNGPQVQALLLKGPARRLGLAVPAVSALSNANAVSPQPDAGQAKPGPDNEPTPHSPLSQGLSDCQLQAEVIHCPQGRYRLASNRALSELDEGVLDAGNRLDFGRFQGDREDTEAVRAYLSDAYDRYIPRMLAIGLGANTMSFTAFHNAFQTLESGNVSFAERMAQTYELLKQDRQRLGVKSRYHDDLPESLSLCGIINRNIIVCDNVGTNWVYVRTDVGR